MLTRLMWRRTGTSLLAAILTLGAFGTTEAQHAAAPTGAKALRVAFILPGSVSDHGYNADGKRSAQLIRSQLKVPVAYTESVQVPNQTDVYRQFASKGYNVVIGWGGQFTDGAVTAAKEFPNVDFIVVNSTATGGKNLASIDTNVEDWQFVGGYVMGKLSKKGVVAWVGGQCFPATAENLHGTEAGARYANPRIKVLHTFTGDFEDPTKAQQATQALIGSGADVISGNLNNGWFGVYKAAEANGDTPVITEWIDNHALAPKVIVSSILKSQARFVLTVVARIKNGTFKAGHYQFGLPKNWGPAISKTSRLPVSVYQQALAVERKIQNGRIHPPHNQSCPK
jgi:basic membrane protein A